jgi:hypothetical protein
MCLRTTFPDQVLELSWPTYQCPRYSRVPNPTASVISSDWGRTLFGNALVRHCIRFRSLRRDGIGVLQFPGERGAGMNRDERRVQIVVLGFFALSSVAIWIIWKVFF